MEWFRNGKMTPDWYFYSLFFSADRVNLILLVDWFSQIGLKCKFTFLFVLKKNKFINPPCKQYKIQGAHFFLITEVLKKKKNQLMLTLPSQIFVVSPWSIPSWSVLLAQTSSSTALCHHSLTLIQDMWQAHCFCFYTCHWCQRGFEFLCLFYVNDISGSYRVRLWLKHPSLSTYWNTRAWHNKYRNQCIRIANGHSLLLNPTLSVLAFFWTFFQEMLCILKKYDWSFLNNKVLILKCFFNFKSKKIIMSPECLRVRTLGARLAPTNGLLGTFLVLYSTVNSHSHCK